MLVTCYVSSRRYLLVNCSDRNETGKLKKPKLSKKKRNKNQLCEFSRLAYFQQSYFTIIIINKGRQKEKLYENGECE